ncbi:hypothetical protein LUPAC06_05415 [Micromonospora saelicesensis]|nr:hypothetical protein LUPAC06_05415 [Micromonospora saelicesensis]
MEIVECAADLPERRGSVSVQPATRSPVSGGPDDSTLSRVLTGIDADALDAAVCRWLLSRPGLTGAGRRVIAVDGRTLRGSGPTGAQVHLLAALNQAAGGRVGEVGDERGVTRAEGASQKVGGRPDETGQILRAVSHCRTPWWLVSAWIAGLVRQSHHRDPTLPLADSHRGLPLRIAADEPSNCTIYRLTADVVARTPCPLIRVNLANGKFLPGQFPGTVPDSSLAWPLPVRLDPERGVADPPSAASRLASRCRPR